jgi:Ca-activated chloride channel family protein
MIGCGSMAEAPMAQLAPPKAHGGTDNVNDAAYDAMFFKHYGVNPYVDTDDDRFSTFAVDVDTGSYTLCRSYLNEGHVPPSEAVRVEEFVNYFDYGYAPPPAASADAFAVHTEAAPSRWSPGRTELRVGLKAREVTAADRKNAILTFVIDVSGSMAREDRLGLVKRALHLLLAELREGDEVGIAVYGSRGKQVLVHRGVADKRHIADAIDSLEPEGATNAEEGITIGYRMARRAFRKGAVNRVIVCSDGVANVGRTGPESILNVIRQEAEDGIRLSTVGFGMGNYNDVLMEQLADNGQGNYAYVDTIQEARRVFVTNLTGTLQMVARDAKVQVEFNRDVVRSYRLLGYENRDVADGDFRNDKVDGGEIGAGHSVTALYELKLWPDGRGMLGTVRVRYADPDTGEVRETERDVALDEAAERFEAASPAFRLASCAAEFAEILRSSYWARGHRLNTVLEEASLCRRGIGEDDAAERAGELINLIEKASRLKAGGPDDMALAEGE